MRTIKQNQEKCHCFPSPSEAFCHILCSFKRSVSQAKVKQNCGKIIKNLPTVITNRTGTPLKEIRKTPPPQ
jgi:hypothetical protein